VRIAGETRAQKRAAGGGIAEGVGAFEFLCETAPTEFDRRGEAACLGIAQARQCGKRNGFEIEQSLEIAVGAQQLAAQIDRALAASPSAEKQREQFRIRKRAAAACEQLFARALGLRPVEYRHAGMFASSEAVA